MENTRNFWRPRERTFDVIADLIDEQRRARETQELMIGGGMAFRTDAGNNFFNQRINDEYSASRKLREYPYEWIEAVKTILEIKVR